MEKDLSQVNFGVSQSDQFMVPASQVESQTDPGKHLPALQQVEEGSGNHSDSEVVYPVMETSGGQSGAVVLVTDSEVEGAEKQEVSGDAQVVEDTVSEDNPDLVGGTSSDDVANVTVVAKGDVAQMEQDASLLSQDLFQVKREEEESPMATPSRHFASLQLSGQPMLVPETVEESLGQICPSPEAYGDMPLIIPSTPTVTPAGEGQEAEYIPGDATTLNSQSDQRLIEAASIIQSQTSSQRRASASASDGEGFAGPTLARDLPDWQQSQSLYLHLSASSGTSQHSTQHQLTQQKDVSVAGCQSQGTVGGNGDQDRFGESQNLRLYLSQSQNSSQQHSVPGAFSLSPSKAAPGLQMEIRQVGMAAAESASLSSPKEDSAQLKQKDYGTAAKAAMSIGMVHTESQSASETMFKLERPDVRPLEGQGSSDPKGEMTKLNIFQRTRQGKKVAAGAPSAILSEDSEDFFADVKKLGKPAEEQSDSSDSIPCSQNRPQCRFPREQVKMDEEVVMESGDAFNVDTVLDSEPEEEEGTQSYEVFPALSKTASPAVAAAATEAMEVDEAQVPELLPSTVNVSPKPQQEEVPPGGSASQSGQAGQPRTLSQHGSQSGTKLSQHAIQQPTERMGSQTRQSSQRSSQGDARLSQRASQQHTAGAGSQTRHSSQQQAAAQQQPSGAGEEAGRIRAGSGMQQEPSRGSQTRSQDRQQAKVNISNSRPLQLISQQECSPVMGDSAQAVSPEYPHPERAIPVISSAVTHPGEAAKETGKEKPSAKVPVPSHAEKDPHKMLQSSRQIASLERDPYTFHASQSQLVETEGATTSRAETSISTLQTSKSKAKGSLGRRRKCLVKKKKEPNPRVEVEKSSSASPDSGALSKSATRPSKKSRKGHVFTQLQQSASGFKRPVGPARRTSKDGKEHEQEMSVDPPARASVVHPQSLTLHPLASGAATKRASLHQPIPSTSSAVVEPMLPTGSQDQLKLLKRKSVEFSSALQLGSSPQQFSLEASLSDSQSSDTVLEVTKVTEYVMRYIKRVTVVQHINKDDQVVNERTTEEESDHEVIEETNVIKKRRLSIPPSPSRSASTLTSGDLADISSSSLSNKASSGPSSLERATSSLELSHPAVLPSAITSRGSVPSTEHSLAGRSSAGASPAVSIISPNQSSIERDDSRLDAVVTSSSSGRGSELLYSADNVASSEIPAAQPPLPPASLSSSSPGIIPPTADESGNEKKTAAQGQRSPRKSTRRAPADSSQEESRQSVKMSPPSESQSFLPGSGSGGFTVAASGSRKKGSSSSDSADKTLRKQTETTRSRTKRSGTSGSSSSEKEIAEAQLSKQGSSELDTTPVAVETASKLDLGARVMCRWKDGFFYPATFIGLNTGIGNKFKVLFEDGLEKTVRAVDLVMVQNLPLGQSVLVMNEEGVCDPGLIIKHIVDGEEFKEKGEVMYEVDMDGGSSSSPVRCKRSKLLLSEDQAACLLSNEEYRATFGERDLSQVNTADVSLDNVILGKRLRTKGSPAVGVPRISRASTSTAAFSDDKDNDDSREEERAGPSKPTGVQGGQGTSEEKPKSRRGSSTATSSARKRAMGPVATSTPTPKQMRTADKQSTPKKTTQKFSPLGAAVESPEDKRPVRKARVGLFENGKGPIPSRPGLFTDCLFLLTHVDKHPTTLAEEKRQLQDSSMELSTGESTDDGGEANSVPFDKDHLKMQIEAGGGTVLSKFASSQVGSGKKLYLISDTHQRTAKYFLCLAANIPSVSHLWIRDSCVQNQLLDYKSYVLPAGISLEKHKLMERVYTVSCLAKQRVLLYSTVPGYADLWTSVLNTADCKVLTKFPPGAAKNRPGVDVVVTDYTCTNSIVDKARQLGVPVVASEWVIQCLINNALLRHDGHPMYAHDYYKEAAKSRHGSGQ